MVRMDAQGVFAILERPDLSNTLSGRYDALVELEAEMNAAQVGAEIPLERIVNGVTVGSRDTMTGVTGIRHLHIPGRWTVLRKLEDRWVVVDTHRVVNKKKVPDGKVW